MNKDIKTQVVVLGGGPAGYSAAFRCCDLGLETILIERYTNLGGVCLNVGCIPSKALLHIAKIIEDTKKNKNNGIVFKDLFVDIPKVCTWKENIIKNLNNGLANMARMRKLKIINGIGSFVNVNVMKVQNQNKISIIKFDNAIIATGSNPINLSTISHKDPRIWDSTDALKLKEIPKRLLIIGGGIIGLEMATIYNALGSQIDIAEASSQIIPAADKDIIEKYSNIIRKKINLLLETKINNITTKADGIYVSMEGINTSTEVQRYDVILVAVGRKPNNNDLNIESIGIKCDEYGFIDIDKQMRTNISNIYAIGDIAGQPMLAHKGIHQGHIAAEVISGLKHYFDPKVIPYICYSDPEVAWAGLTEKEAKKNNIKYEVATFPWTFSGRAIASQCENGVTKLIFDKKTHNIIGGAIVGTNGGELLSEICLAIEMACDAQDIALTVHAHPTLYESIGLASEIFEGTITDMLNIKTKH
ncbi:MAG: dihydrolipoyl dehydrogenase [Pantoea sp. Brub]|nr:dihydrolipoyl dehydrogenase [Pantoea sp. Brub]